VAEWNPTIYLEIKKIKPCSKIRGLHRPVFG
jgi:hypothetical protein